MPIVSSQITGQINKPGGRRKLLMQATDHTGKIWERRPNAPADNDDDATLAAWVVELGADLPNLEAQAEAYRAKNGRQQDAQHQPQADLDRKTINELMQIENSLEFAGSLQWFRDFETRAGANTNARANYLGVPKVEYDLVATRYNQITGVKDTLEADAARIWNNAVGR